MLLDRCKMRINCNYDSGGDYGLILHDLHKVIGIIRMRDFAGDKRFVAKTLKTNLKSIFKIVQGHTMSGQGGVASVLFNELSGLAGSAMIRRVSKTLRDSAGRARGGRGGGPGGRFEQAPNVALGAFPRFQQRNGAGGRGGFGPGGNIGFRRNNLNQAPGGFGARGQNPRQPLRCFACQELGHMYQQCPNGRAQQL